MKYLVIPSQEVSTVTLLVHVDHNKTVSCLVCQVLDCGRFASACLSNKQYRLLPSYTACHTLQ